MQRISLNKSRNASLGWRNASMGVWYHPSYGHKHSEYLLFIPRKTVASRIGHHGVTNRSSRGDESQVWGYYFNFTMVNRKNKIHGQYSHQGGKLNDRFSNNFRRTWLMMQPADMILPWVKFMSGVLSVTSSAVRLCWIITCWLSFVINKPPARAGLFVTIKQRFVPAVANGVLTRGGGLHI